VATRRLFYPGGVRRSTCDALLKALARPRHARCSRDVSGLPTPMRAAGRGRPACHGVSAVTRAGFVAGALLALRAAPATAVPFVLARSFTEPMPVRFDVFGAAVAAAGSAIAIGASRNDAAGTDAGAVYLVAAGDEFGSALAAVGTHLAVGSPDATAGAPRAGVVTLFPLGGTVPERVIPNPAPAASELFGSALAALGSSLAIGVPYRDAPGAAAAGAVYLVDPDSGATLL